MADKDQGHIFYPQTPGDKQCLVIAMAGGKAPSSAALEDGTAAWEAYIKKSMPDRVGVEGPAVSKT